MHKSVDGGDSWQVMEDGLPVAELSDGHHCSFGFPSAIDLKSGNVFVVPLDGDNFRFPRGGQLAVYRSRRGANWEKLTSGLPANCYTAVLRGALSADQQGGLYVGTASGTDLRQRRSRRELDARLASGLPRIMSRRGL